MNVDVNYFAVIVAAIVNMVIGSVWYGPAFGKTWRVLAGFNSSNSTEMPNMKKIYLIALVSSLVMAFAFFNFIVYGAAFTGMVGTSSGLAIGFWLWLGFAAPIALNKVLWEGKTWKLWFIESGYYLVLFLVNGAILGAWM